MLEIFKKNDAKFINRVKLKFEVIDDNEVKWYSLKQNLAFYDGNKIISVPAKTFLTDGTTIPKYLHWLIDPLDKRFLRSAILHDFAYTEKHISRVRADWLFLKALKSEGVNWFLRWSMFLSVRVCGRRYYDR